MYDVAVCVDSVTHTKVLFLLIIIREHPYTRTFAYFNDMDALIEHHIFNFVATQNVPAPFFLEHMFFYIVNICVD